MKPAPAALLLCSVLALAGCAHGRAADARATAEAGRPLFSCDCTLVGLGVGRDRPEGPDRLWAADGRRVYAVLPDGRFEEVWRVGNFGRLLRFEARDLDGDGVHEWVVVVDAGQIRSEVVGVSGGERVRLGKRWGGFLRAATLPDGSTALVGQRAGVEEPFWGEVTAIAFDDKGRPRPAEGLPPLPRDADLFDWFFLPADPPAEARLYVLEWDGRVTERDPRSPRAVLWRSDGRPAARPVERRRTYRGMMGEESEELLRIAPPLPVGDFDGDGRAEGLLVAGAAPPVPVFEGIRIFQGGDVRLARPASPGLDTSLRTPVVGRAVAAAVPWELDGRPVWAAAVWTRAPTDPGRPESRILLFEAATGELVRGEAAPAEAVEPPTTAPPKLVLPPAEGAANE